MTVLKRRSRWSVPAVLVMFAALALPSALEAQKNCVRGKPCGNTCIARNKTCRVGTGSARAATLRPTTAVQVPEGMQYVASTRGRTYYDVGCRGWRSLAVSNLRWFPSRAEAEQAGLRASVQPGCAGAAESEESIALTGPPAAVPGVTFAATCVVARVVDGDTFQCGDERIRILLIDAPELDQGPFGAPAQEALIRLLPAGTHVGIETDVELRDRYGRLLAYVYAPGGQLVNEEMLRLGYAVVSVYPPNVKYVDRFRATQEQARAAAVGLWSVAAFDCLPADHRAGTCEL